MIKTRKWHVGESGTMIYRENQTTLKFTSWYAEAFASEGQLWEKYYLPSFSLKGLTVLDVGAGEGETAYFYFKHGARKVICVENNPLAIQFLEQNLKDNDWNAVVIPKAFESTMLTEHKVDFMKMDGEGCEKELLKLDQLAIPSFIEVHDPETLRLLHEKFGLEVIKQVSPNIWWTLVAINRSLQN
jgi:tRNA G37 N-methylase Trm5